jgi:hypothetical protein
VTWSWPGQRLALSALRQAVLVADLDGWRQPLAAASFGPLRSLARGRIRRALITAGERLGQPVTVDETTRLELKDEPDPVGARVALLQAAWLIAAGRSELVNRPSIAAVLMTEGLASALVARRAELASAYWAAQLPVQTGSRGWLKLALASTLILALGLTVFFATRPDEPEPAPAVWTELSYLGEEREAAWIDALSDWVVALDRLTRLTAEGGLDSSLREAKDNLDAHKRAILELAVGPDGAPLPRAVLDATTEVLETGMAATRAGDDWETREDHFAEAVRRWNRALREHRLGYFFDAYAALYPGRGEVGLFAFRVEAAPRYRQTDPSAADSPTHIDALHLRRIDKLNLVQFLLGYTSRRMDVAVVLLDKLEHQLATRLGPALVPNAPMPLELEDDTQLATSIKGRAGQLVREAFNTAFPNENQALTELGELLQKRNALFTRVNERLAPRGIKMTVPERLELAPDYLDQLERVTSPSDRAELADLQDRLTAPSMRRLFARLLLRHASSVERHEVQHRLDFADPEHAVPTALLSAMGVEDTDENRKERSIERAASELSAYTAELARDPGWVMVNLALLTEHLYDGSGGAEGWSAILILDGLAELVGIYAADNAPRRLLDSLPLDSDDVAPVHLALMATRPAALSEAAATLWQRWYGRPLAIIEREDTPP